MRRDDLTAMLPLRDEIVVDSFAGGGGASTGIESALGRPVDVAIDHDPQAIEMHRQNHSATVHYTESVFKVDPEAITGLQPVGLLWASPDCTHHSKAKGGAPRSPRVRGLAWVVIRWARRVKPRVIMLENVEEFEDWGPLLNDGRPCPDRRGTTFRLWINQLRAAGYAVEWRQLRACDFGAPTTRKRLFVIARRDGLPIVWPRPTHGPGLRPYRSAAECIDWSIECPSIFERARPLAENTMRRIAAGVRRYVLGASEPFVVASGSRHEQMCAFLAKHFTGVVGQSLGKPIGTVTTIDHHSLVTAATRGAHAADVRAFLSKYYGNERDGCALTEPLHTITTVDRFALAAVAGARHEIADIGMRMLQPRELYRAQGFPDDYVIEFEHEGRALSKSAQVRMCGNSVCPPVAAALVRANFAHERAWRREWMAA
jgi:DNA (cytosine-5)-methyltransferase 1